MLLLVAALSFFGGVFLFLRIGLDDNRLTILVASRLERSVGRRVSLISAHLSWVSSGTMRLSLRGLNIYDKSGSCVVLAVPKATIELDTAPMIFGRLLVGLVRLTEPVLAVSDEQDPRMVSDQQALPKGPRVLWLAPKFGRVEISGGRLIQENCSGNAQRSRDLLSAIDVVAINATTDSVDSVTIQGLAHEGTVSGSFQASGRLTANQDRKRPWLGEIALKMGLCPVSPVRVIASCLGYEFPLTEGIVNLNGHVKGHFADFQLSCEMELTRASLLPGRHFGRGVFLDRARAKMGAIREGTSLRVDFPELLLPGLALSAETIIKEVESRSPELEIVLRRADFDLARFFPLVPESIMAAEDRTRFGEAGLKGHVVITGGAWIGALADIMTHPWRKGRLSLDAYLDRVSAFIPGMRLPIKDATGRVRLSADEVIFNGISLTLGASPIVLNGGITDLQTNPRSDLFVSMTAQAQDLTPLLSNAALAGRIGSWLGWIEEPHGGIAVTMDVKGTLDKPSMKGRILLDNFQCRVPRLPLMLRSISGSLRFRGADIIFSGLKGNVGDGSAEFGGKVSPDNMAVTGELRLTQTDLKKLGVLPASWEISGILPVSLSLKGRSPGTDFSAKLDLKGNGIKAGTVLRKEPGILMELEASGTWSPEGVSVEEAYMILENSRLSAKAKVDPDGKVAVFLNLPPKGIPTNVLIPLADPGRELQPGGRVEGDAVIKFDTNRPRDFFLEANLLLNHVSLRMGLYKRVDGLTGSLRWKGKSVNAVVERAKVGASELSGHVVISDIHRPKIEILLDFSFLDTTDFTAPPGHVSPLTWGEWIRSSPVMTFLARSVGTGTIKASKGKTATRPFANFHASFEDHMGQVRIPHWQISIADGIVRGDGQFDIRANTRKPLHLDFQADHLRMERVFMWDPDRVRAEGDVTAEGHLEWQTTSGRERHGVSRTGKIEVRVQQGIIHRFEVLSKIFSLINLGSLMRGRFPDIVSEGLPFQKLSWTMDVFDDKWRFQDVKLTSDAARMDAWGMYFSSQNRIDFKVEVSPLVGLDAIVSGILGNLVTRNGKTLSTTFSVRGLPSTPDVRLEPFANFKLERN